MILDETFELDGDAMIRSVIPKRGRPYEHVCWLPSYQEVLHTIDEQLGEPFVYESIVSITELPNTQVAVAIAFLKERSVIIPARFRQSRAAGSHIYLDGMCEWTALQKETAT